MGDNNEFENNEFEQENQWQAGCKCCGSPVVQEGYNLELCEECRKKLSKRPIPKKFLFLAAGILIILVISLFKFPGYINAGIEFKRAEKAIDEHKYVTAMNYYENVVDENSKYENKIKLMELYYYNGYISEAYDIYESLVGEKIDEEYYNKATKIMNDVEKYYIYKDELYDKVNEVEDGDSDKLLELIKPYVDSDPKEICGASTIIDIYMDKKMFNEAKPIAERIVSENPDYDYGKYELSLIYIELGEYDKALNVAEDLFYSNKESIYGYVCKSKAELKKGNNQNGLIIAERACKLDPYNSFAATNLVLAYHYNGMIEERDSMYQYCLESEFIEKDNYLKSIFSGEYKWQEGEKEGNI